MPRWRPASNTWFSAGSKMSKRAPVAPSGRRTSPTRRRWRPTFAACPSAARLCTWRFSTPTSSEYYVPQREADGLAFAIYSCRRTSPCRSLIRSPPPGRRCARCSITRTQYAGQSLPVIGEILSAQDMVDTFVRVTGQRARYASAYAREDFLRHFPALGADEHFVRELVGMVEYAVEYGYYAPERDLTWSRKIDPHALTWEQFLKRSNWQGELLTLAPPLSPITPISSPREERRDAASSTPRASRQQPCHQPRLGAHADLRIVAQGDPLQCAEGIARRERMCRGRNHRIHRDPVTLVTPLISIFGAYVCL